MIVAQTKIRVIILKYCDICLNLFTNFIHKKNLIFVIPYFCSLNSEEKRRRRRKSLQTFFVISKLKFEREKKKVSRLLL